jgi:hypothetical protein
MDHRTIEYAGTRGTLFVVLAVGLLWVAMLSADWFFRFAWYHWQVTLVARPAAVVEGPDQPMIRRDTPEARGGDLTSLLGLPDVARRFAVVHPAGELVTDEFGFRNRPPARGRHYPIVAAGDSYMVSGTSTDDMFDQRLARISGQPVYNYAFAGRGPLFGVERFLRDERFREAPPRVLVWGLVEREIEGGMFASMAARLATLDQALSNAAHGGRFYWSALTPKALKTSLPSTSIIAQASKKTWNHVRYLLFGAITPEVAMSTASVEGQPLLFYTWSVEAMRWTPAERKPGLIIDAVASLAGYCRERGVKLVVMLIPDKEQVYRELLPPSIGVEAGPLPASALYEIEKGLKGCDVCVVNLLDPFRSAAREGSLLYWPDDTHWNSKGMELAAQQVWHAVEEVFPR